MCTKIAPPRISVVFILLLISLWPLAGSAEQKPQTSKPIRFAYENRIGGALPIIALRKGFFEKQGLNVTGLQFTSGPAIYESMFLGSAELGTMGDTAAVIALSKSDRFIIIASQATGEHRHRLIVKKNAPYHTLTDLQGKKVAIKKGTSTYGGFLAALQRAGMSSKKIEVLDLPPETMPDAFAAGSIEAFAASEPTPSQGELLGGRELMTLGGLGNNYPIMILARAELVSDRPEDLVRFLRGLAESESFLKNHPDKARQIVEQATGLPKAVVESAMSRHDFTLRLDQAVQRSLAEIGNFLLSQKIVTSLPPLASYTNANFLEKARAN